MMDQCLKFQYPVRGTITWFFWRYSMRRSRPQDAKLGLVASIDLGHHHTYQPRMLSPLWPTYSTSRLILRPWYLDNPFKDAFPYNGTIVFEFHSPEHFANDSLVLDIKLEPALDVLDPQLCSLGILFWMALKGQNCSFLVDEAVVGFGEADESPRLNRDCPSMVLL